MPTPEEADALVQAMRSAPGWLGPRNAAFLLTLARRGQRVGALLRLDGCDLHRLPNGGVRIILSAKSSPRPAELAVPDVVQTELERYIHDFNHWAKSTSLPYRIGFGVPGAFWRGDTGKRWSYENWRRELHSACQQAETPRLTAHSFRRAFATEAVSVVSRSLAALAGTWTSPRRMDDHYVQPAISKLTTRLANLANGRRPGPELADQSLIHRAIAAPVF